jgi:hypothetical protein
MAVADRKNVLAHEPADVYHAQAKDYLTSHQLGDFRKCPLLYRRKTLGLIADEDRPAYVVGRAAHTLILEGTSSFEADFAVGGPINPKTGTTFGPNTKAWSEWAESQNKPVLTETQFDLIARMKESVRTHLVAISLLADGEAEGVARANYCGMSCQIRMDWFDAHQGIVDLKTCDDLTWFEADARRFGYAHQLAFYRAVLAQVFGLAMPVHLIAVEKREPYRTGVWKVSDEALRFAQRENEAAIERLKRCLDTGVFPTGYEETRIFDLG